MKKISQYFYAGCTAYTVVSLILVIICLIEHRENFEIKSYANIIFLIVIIQIILYFMEDLQIKSQVVHIAIELSMSIFITFAAGISMKLVRIDSIHEVINIIVIISLTYGVTMSGIYISSKEDAESINKKLNENR